MDDVGGQTPPPPPPPPRGPPPPPLPPYRGDHDTCSPGSARTLRPPPGFAFGRRLLGRTGSCRTGPPPSWRIVTPRRGDRGPRVCGRRGELGSRWPRHGTLWRCLRGGVVIKAMMMMTLEAKSSRFAASLLQFSNAHFIPKKTNLKFDRSGYRATGTGLQY